MRVYSQYADGYPRPLDIAIETRTRLAELYNTEVDDDALYAGELAAIIELDAGAGSDRTDRSRFLAAKAALVLAERRYESFAGLELRQPFETSLADKQARMDATLEALSALVNYEVADVTAAATFYIAETYRDFSQSLLASERPAGLSAAELADYDLVIEEEAWPFEEQAIGVHEKNFELLAGGVYNGWVQRSLDELAELMPGTLCQSRNQCRLCALARGLRVSHAVCPPGVRRDSERAGDYGVRTDGGGAAMNPLMAIMSAIGGTGGSGNCGSGILPRRRPTGRCRSLRPVGRLRGRMPLPQLPLPQSGSRWIFVILTLAFVVAGCATAPPPKPESTIAVDAAVGFTITEDAVVEIDVRSDYERALALIEAGDREAGIALLTEVAESAPGLSAPRIDLGIALHESGNLEAAESELDRALELIPDHPIVLNELGILYRKTARFDAARRAYEAALAVYPGYHYARRNLGILCDLYLADADCALANYEAYMAAVVEDAEVEMWIADLSNRQAHQEE